MQLPQTLSFEDFWAWVVHHPNCILRAGTPESVIYDDDDFHWLLAQEDNATVLVQVLRGKRPVGEILLAPAAVTYVQAVSGEREGEVIFELIVETEKEHLVAYFFVLTHGIEEDEDPLSAGPVH